MIKINYVKTNNNFADEKLEGSLVDCLNESALSFMFSAGIIPPFEVLYDLFMNLPVSDELELNKRMNWEPFELSFEDYRELADNFLESLKLSQLNDNEIPTEINNVYFWYLWQYEYKFGVPYEEHKRLYDGVKEAHKQLESAIQSNNEDEITKWHLKHYTAGRNLAKFVKKYLPHDE